mgnify:CR=1 FL=1
MIPSNTQFPSIIINSKRCYNRVGRPKLHWTDNNMRRAWQRISEDFSESSYVNSIDQRHIISTCAYNRYPPFDKNTKHTMTYIHKSSVTSNNNILNQHALCNNNSSNVVIIPINRWHPGACKSSSSSYVIKPRALRASMVQ